MKNNLLIVIATVFSLSAEAMIYGTDDRVLVRESSPAIKEQAKSIAMFIEFGDEQLKQERQGQKVSFPVLTLKEQIESKNDLPVCSDLRFQSESRVATCTAFLVGEKIAMTAGHCLRLAAKGPNEPKNFTAIANQVPGTELENIRLVFDHYYQGQALKEIPLEKIYRISKVVKAQFHQGIDFALIELDRVVKDISPLPVEKNIESWIESHQIHKDELYALGYNLGLPLMASHKGYSDWAFYPFFKFFLDIANGNSGSPIFNAKTNKVVGILSGVSFADSMGDLAINSERNCIEEKHRQEGALDRPLGLFVKNFLD